MRQRVPAAAALFLFVVGLVIGGVDNGFVALRYPFAFESPLDRSLFVAFFTVATALVSGIAGLILGLVARLFLRSETSRGGAIDALLTVLGAGPIGLAGLVALNAFAYELREDLTSLAWTIGVAAGALGVARILVLASRPKTYLTGSWRQLTLVGVVVGLGLAAGAVRVVLVPRDGAATRSGLTLTADRHPAAPSSSLTLDPGTNVVLILVDTLRADHLSYAGYPRETSPNIDALASRGVVFERCVAQATRTSPNMASLLTGQSFFRHGIVMARTRLPGSFLTWPELLRGAGYRTAAIVGNPNVGRSFRFTQGVDEVEECFHEPSQSRAEPMVTKAIRWLESEPEQPFFLWLHLVDPHTPYDPPPPYDDWFVGDEVYERQADRVLPLTGESRHGGIFREAEVGGLRSLADYVARYDGEIRYADQWIGELLHALDRFGLTDDTLVVFASDHGESLGEHDFYFSHGTYSYEPTARVPLILSHPGLPQGLRVESMSRTVDVLPTVLDLLGLPLLPEFEGRSLARVIRGGRSEPHVASITSGFKNAVTLAARTERWKLILTPVSRPGLDRWNRFKLGLWPNAHRARSLRQREYRVELYDLAADALETTSLAGQGRAIEANLRARILDWVDEAAVVDPAQGVEDHDLDPTVLRRLQELGYFM